MLSDVAFDLGQAGPVVGGQIVHRLGDLLWGFFVHESFSFKSEVRLGIGRELVARHGCLDAGYVHVRVECRLSIATDDGIRRYCVVWAARCDSVGPGLGGSTGGKGCRCGEGVGTIRWPVV